MLFIFKQKFKIIWNTATPPIVIKWNENENEKRETARHATQKNNINNKIEQAKSENYNIHHCR